MSDLFWDNCLAHIQADISPQQFNTWIKPLQGVLENNTLTIYAPNRFVLKWVKDRFLNKVEAFALESGLASLEIKMSVSTKKADDIPLKKPTLVEKSTSSALEQQPSTPVAVNNRNNQGYDKKINQLNQLIAKKNNIDSGLSDKLNFDNYVTGRANQLARAAAIQVAENPGGAYNPLYIYGGVGLGKTHLLQSIGNHLRLHNPNARINYLHAEKYISGVVKAYELKAFDAFKKHYHSLDLLLIDDIQFFGKKNRTQEEFFYAFNSLIEAKKQIVITSDKYPKELTDLEERLQTRFSWGLTVEVEPPELEMRVAILMKKAELMKVKLDEEVAFFIAKQIRSNVRELEGALNRIVAMAKFTGSAIDVVLAKEALKDLIAVRGRQVTIENIQKTVADYYKIKVAEMYSKKRTRNFARPRQIAMALARELTNHSFPEIGEAFGGRHHTTIMHACDEVESMRKNDPKFANDINFLMQVIRN